MSIQHVNTIHRTLIIRFSSVGDIILSSLLVRGLRKRFPSSTIDFLVKQEHADLVQHNPNISHVVIFPTNGGLADLRSLRAQVRTGSYDLLVDIHDSLRSRYVCFRHPHVVRIRKRKIARFLLVKTKWSIYDWFGGAPSVAERYLETVGPFGVHNDGNGLELFFPQAESEKAVKSVRDAGISDEQLVIGVCPAAKHNNKMWLKERFAETGASLAREYRAAVFLFGSGKAEEALCHDISDLIEQQSPGIHVLNLADRVSLLQTAALMDRCSIIITNDSGLMHLAAARKRNIVAIFGPTVRELGFFPYGTTSTVIEDASLSCRPCTPIGLPRCPKGHFNCMKAILANRVIDAARMLLNDSPDT